MTDKTITLPQQKAMVVSSFRLQENGATAIGDPSFEEWESCLQFVKSAGKSVHFWLGDLINYGEKRWGEKYKEAVSVTGFDYGTLRNDCWVASRIPPERRQESLSFEHHKEVANKDEEEQDELLTKAAAKQLTRDQFRKLIKSEYLHMEQKKEILSTLSPIEKAKASGRQFAKDLQAISGMTINSDDRWDFEDIFESISEGSSHVRYEAGH